MRVAIATALFDDQQRIGSQRPRALASELAAQGHEVTVFTVGSGDDDSGMPPGVRVVRLGPLSWEDAPKTGWAGLIRKMHIAWAIAPTLVPRRRIARHVAGGTATAEDYAELAQIQNKRVASIRMIDDSIATRPWVRNAKRQFSSLLESEGLSQTEPEYDVVFSTFGALGRLFREEGLARVWIQDFRDPASLTAFLPTVTRRLQRNQKSLLTDADAITVVSEGFKRALVATSPGSKPKITILSNGFRKRNKIDMTETTEALESGILRIGYAGTVYGQQSEALTLFMKEVGAVDSVYPGVIELHYAGRDLAAFTRCANEAHVENLVRDHGLLTHAESLDMQTSMNALLALSWNTSASQGVLSGKFLEYLGADRPIVAVVAGEVPDSELSQVVQRLNVGICCEAAGGKSDRERLREWITSAVESRANSMPVTFEPNSDEVSQLEYGEISKQLVGISESLVQRD